MTDWQTDTQSGGERPGAGRRALVVDDSRAIRAMLRRLLTGLGFEVAEGGNGAEGLTQLYAAAEPVDLVLCDWNMPVMDGLTFLKTMRAERRFADVVVLMVSSESDPAKVARALMRGADDYVIKPLTADVLLAKLDMLSTWRSPVDAGVGVQATPAGHEALG
jgi:two-component system chemotaxis response regulator CheY